MTAGRTIPLARLLHREAVGLGADDQQPTGPRQAICCSPRASTTSAKSISVKRADTVVLGLGHATLTAVDGAVPLTVDDVPGVIVAGVTIDAGTVESPVLLQVGKKNGNNELQEERPVQPDHALGRVLPRRWAARRQGRRRARGQQRQRPDRSHVGVACRPRRRGLLRRHRALEHQHRPQRRRRQRRQRDGDRPVRRALPAVQHRLERRERRRRSCTRTSCRTTRRPRRTGCTTASRAGPATRSETR